MEVDVPETVSSLSTALTTLESALAPLLAVPLKELLANEEDGREPVAPLQQARTQILTAYLVHDLIWIYLKTAAVEPETHPVMAELDRLKSYFGKLKSAEAPPAQRMQIDKDAARRFIKAAIGSNRDASADAGPSGTHTRFDGGAEEEEEGSDESAQDEAEDKEVVKELKEPKKAQSKRPKMDPFAGYDAPKGKKSNPQAPKADGSPAQASPRSAKAGGSSSGSPALSKHQKKKAAAAKMKKGATHGTD